MHRLLKFTGTPLLLAILLLFTGQVSLGQAQDPPIAPDAPLGTAFTYQGFLVYQGSYYDGVCDFRFSLYNVQIGGAPIADPLTKLGVRVKNGHFTVKLDFGEDVITGTKRWLQIAVACPSPAEPGAITILRPRQELTPTPHALALPGLWTQPGGSPNLIGGYYGNTVGDNAKGATIGGGGHRDLSNAQVTWPYPPLVAEDANRADSSVNAVKAAYGTVSGGLGNSSALLAVVGGGAYNDATGPGAAIGGGGLNTASDLAVTVAGGYKNWATGPFAAIGGGQHNTAAYTDTAVSGGAYNKAGKTWAAIGGGAANTADGYGATVAGGGINVASGNGAAIAGGGFNIASNHGTTVGGGQYNRAGSKSTVADPAPIDPIRAELELDTYLQDPVTVDPRPFEPLPTPPDLRGIYATVGGGAYNTADGPGATIGGGGVNTASGLAATIGGGYRNQSAGDFGAIGGGEHNSASANGATIGGGGYNTANNYRTTVGGGQGNRAGNIPTPVVSNALESSFLTLFPDAATNDDYLPVDPTPVDPPFRGRYATVGGGAYNTAGGPGAVVDGGGLNTAAGLVATVGGGYKNRSAGTVATVGGGEHNYASGHRATVGGGGRNLATGRGATIGGGGGNSAGDGSVGVPEAAGIYATVPGGFQNSAQGNYSLAAGQRAKANHQGAFVWADASDADLESTGPNQFIVRASGGIWLGQDSNPGIQSGAFLDTSTGAWLSTTGTWHNSSDRAAKENFTPVDGQEILKKLAELPLSTWNYKLDDRATRHLGPTAQDFQAAFNLGSSDTSIATVDTDGVALAGIQGLYELVQAQDARLTLLQAQNEALAARMARLEALVETLTQEAQAGGRQ